MSHRELAKYLNVAAATVEQWENGYAVPEPPVQRKLYEICKESTVSACDLSLSRIVKKAENVSSLLSKNRLLLYHGSKSGLEGKIAPKSRSRCDFGRGFYMGTEPSQALELICDYEESRLYILSVDLTGLDIVEVPVSIDWAMLVAYHRGRMENIKGTPFYGKYRDMTKHKDFVIGSIANDRMFYVLDNFFAGNVTDAALVGSLSALRLGKQYVAITQKGCDTVRIEAEIALSCLERLFLKDLSEKNRAAGVSLANDICKKYRREGLFFDELLDRAKNGGFA